MPVLVRREADGEWHAENGMGREFPLYGITDDSTVDEVQLRDNGSEITPVCIGPGAFACSTWIHVQDADRSRSSVQTSTTDAASGGPNPFERGGPDEPV